MANVTKRQVLQLYRSLIRESQKFSSYNFRSYALRRIRDGFRENKSVTDPSVVRSNFLDAQKNLDIVKRQVIIGNMYAADELVIEKEMKKST